MLALLLGGNLATEVLLAAALGMFANALGYDIGLTNLLLINISRRRWPASSRFRAASE
jgi:hypothetical protein